MNPPRRPRPRRSRSQLRQAICAASLATFVIACGSDTDLGVDDAEDAVQQAGDSLDDVAASADQTSSLVADTLRENGLTSVASAVELIDFSQIVDVDEFTFFAPNDDAFTSLSADELADMLADPTEVAEVLRNHTLSNRLEAADLRDGDQVTTEAGNALTVRLDGDRLSIADADVVQSDIDVSGGVIHVVDQLIVP